MASSFSATTIARHLPLQYNGSLLAVAAVAACGLFGIITGLAHMLMDDGGAGVIAGIDLSTRAQAIVAIFAWAGATQFVWGILLLAIALFWRDLVPLALGLGLLEQSLIALNAWVLKPVGDGTHPPATYLALGAVAMLSVTLLLTLRPRKNN